MTEHPLRWIGPVTRTRHPRIVIIIRQHLPRGGTGWYWRTACCDDLGSWSITGPPYPTKLEAVSQIDRLTEDWFGGVTE